MKCMYEMVRFVYESIHAIRPGLSGTVPDFGTVSRRPENYEIVPEIQRIKSTDFLRPIFNMKGLL